MATVYKNQHLGQLENMEMYSKIPFVLYKMVLNKINGCFMMLKCNMAHDEACVKMWPP